MVKVSYIPDGLTSCFEGVVGGGTRESELSGLYSPTRSITASYPLKKCEQRLQRISTLSARQCPTCSLAKLRLRAPELIDIKGRSKLIQVGHSESRPVGRLQIEDFDGAWIGED